MNRTEKRWAVLSPKYGLIVMENDDTRRAAQSLLRHERGRQVVRATLTYQVPRRRGGQPGASRE